MILHPAHPRPPLPPEVQDIVSALMSSPLQITALSRTLQNSKVKTNEKLVDLLLLLFASLSPPFETPPSYLVSQKMRAVGHHSHVIRRLANQYLDISVSRLHHRQVVTQRY